MALFYPYIAHEQTAHNLDFVSSLLFLLNAIPPEIKVRSRAIEWFQRAMHPALSILHNSL
jgi:hypothetical protein